MNRLESKRTNQTRRAHRTRIMIKNGGRLRLCVNISNKAVYAQIIDDDKKTTLLTVNSLNLDNGKQNLTQLASAVGTEVGKKAKAKKIKRVSFDRGAKLYHGRIKALAESARKEGLEF